MEFKNSLINKYAWYCQNNIIVNTFTFTLFLRFLIPGISLLRRKSEGFGQQIRPGLTQLAVAINFVFVTVAALLARACTE